MLPMGLYRAEVIFASDTALRTLRGAAFSVVRTRCELGANASLAFAEEAIRGKELDPELRIAQARLQMLGRV